MFILNDDPNGYVEIVEVGVGYELKLVVNKVSFYTHQNFDSKRKAMNFANIFGFAVKE